VDVNVKDEDGDTPLLRAVANRNVTVVRLLLGHHGVDVDLPGKGSCTPLLRAAKLWHSLLVKCLLQHRAVDVNARDANGGSSLWWAVSQGREAIVELLLEHPNIDLDAGMREAYGSLAETSPLAIARRRGRPRVVTMLDKRCVKSRWEISQSM
jgi:ankyrin repeat protein